MDAFGQSRAGQRLPDTVVADVCHLAQAVEQAQRLKNSGIDADADAGISSLDPLQCRSGSEGAFGDDRHGQPPTTTGILDVRPELAQCPLHRGGRSVWSRNMTPWHYVLERYVARRLQYF